MFNWGFSVSFNNGFGIYLGTVQRQAILEHDEDGNEVTLIVHGFELLLPFLCVQFLEIMEYEGHL